MTCAEHLWWFATACPQCEAAAAPVTAPVTDEGEDLPDFLQRNPDGSFKYPSSKVSTRSVSAPVAPRSTNPLDELAAVAAQERVAPPPMFPEGWEDLPLADRQKYYQKLHAMQKREKDRQRLEQLNADKRKPE